MKNTFSWRCISAISLFFLLSAPVFAQNGFQLQHYTDANGLPQNSIKFVTADNAGYIWLSTEDGLVRFDGFQFITHEMQNLPIKSNRIQAFFNSNDSLYAYTANYDPILINGGKATVTKRLPNWLALGKDLATQTSSNNSKTYLPGDRHLENGSINLNYTKSDQFKELYIYSENDTVYKYDNQTLSVYYKNKLIRDLDYKCDHDWQFFLINNQLFSLDETGIITSFGSKALHSKLEGDILTEMSPGNKTRTDIKLLWNICSGNQVILIADKSLYLATRSANDKITTKLLYKGFDARAENICSSYYDAKSGVLFLGSSTKGLFILTPTIFSTISAKTGENIFGSQIEYQNNKILTTGNHSINLSLPPYWIQQIEHIQPIDYLSLSKDRLSGNIWAFFRQRLLLLSAQTLKELNHWQLPSSINALYQGSDNILWIGTIAGQLYQKKDSASAPVSYCNLQSRINYILNANSHELYIGTAQGLYQINLANKQRTIIKHLETKSIRQVFLSKSGKIWVTTYGDGFYLLDGEQAISLPLDRDHYLRNSHYILQDQLGFMWIPTNKGIFKISEYDLLNYVNNGSQHSTLPYYYYFNKLNGFKTNEFNGGCQPCAIKLKNGIRSLPSMNGLVLFNPDSAKLQLPVNDLHIDKIIVDSQMANKPDLLALPEDFNQFNIYVSSPFLGNHKNLQISYALTENDSKGTMWFPISADNKITISRLTHGHYTLLIRKVNGFGLDNISVIKVPIIIEPKWFHSIWFGIGLILLFPILGICVGNYRSKYIARKNKELEKKIEEKTLILNKRANMQELIIRAIGHDIRTPLKYHILLTEKIRTLTENADEHLAKKSDSLNQSSKQLFQLVNNFVLYLEVQRKNEIITMQGINLNDVLNKKLVFFEQIAAREHTLLLNIDTSAVIVNSDPELLSIILHNLIDNAIKVTSYGVITTQIGISRHNRPYLTITDSGPGLKEPLLSWINNESIMEKIQQREEMPVNCGLGLMMIKQLVKLLKIRLTAQVKQGEGSTFTLIFER